MPEFLDIQINQPYNYSTDNIDCVGSKQTNYEYQCDGNFVRILNMTFCIVFCYVKYNNYSKNKLKNDIKTISINIINNLLRLN